jgi:AmiR/NasT family two-component response regulator
MRTATASRAIIEQAKGGLMDQSGLSPDEAFSVLVRENRKLREIAADLMARARDRAPRT